MVTLTIRSVTEAVDFADLGEPVPAVRAPAQMGAHAMRVPCGEPSAHLSAQPVAGPPALRVFGRGHMLL